MANSAQRKFGRAAKKALSTCHAETTTTGAFKTCMRREMRKNLRSEGFRVKGGGAARRRGRKRGRRRR